MRNRKHDGNKSSVVNFGVQGWVTILYCLLMFWLYAGMVNSGSNVTAPAIAEKHYGQGHKRQTTKRGLLTTNKG